MCNSDVLKTITDEVVKHVYEHVGNKLDKVILYGSYARGDYDDESDIDIMILVNSSQEELKQYQSIISELASDLGLEHDIYVSLYLKDCETFYKFLHVEPFYINVIREGVILSA